MPKDRMHSQQQISAFLKEIKTQTDRGAAIIAVAVLDDLLELLILARFIELGSERKDGLFDRSGAPLGTFSAKIEMGYALGILTNEIRLALHLIRDVRNKFAHQMAQITFEHPDVANMMQNRAFQALKKPGRSNKDVYTDMFSAVATVLYGTLAADIRIQSLEKTHQEHFVKLALHMADIVRGATSEKPPQTPD